MKRKLKGQLSIKKEIFLVGFLSFILLSLLFAGIFLWFMYNSSKNNVKSELRGCNEQIVTYMEGMFHESSTIIEMLSLDEKVINADEDSYAQVAANLKCVEKMNPRVTYIYAGYADGTICVTDYPIPDGYRSQERRWYQAAMLADGVAQSSYRDLYTGEWLFSQSKKLVDKNGNMTGVIAIDCSNENINQQLSEKYQYESQRSFLVSPDGVILAHPDDKEVNVPVQRRISSEEWKQVIKGERNYVLFERNGVQKIAYFEWIPGAQLLAGTSIDKSEVYEPVYYGLIYLFILILAVSLILSFILSKVLSLRFAGPLIELAERVQHLSRGGVDEIEETGFTNKEIDEIADGVAAIVREAAQKEERRKAAEYMSFHDSMTGLHNRRFFERELMKLDVKQYLPLCIVACDLNGLKFVNDVFGHAAGDRLISLSAECLKEGCGKNAVIARTGGDEFTVILPETSEEEADRTAQKIQEAFEHKSVCGIEVSVSIGYAVKKDSEQPVGDVLKAADEMMYVQKLSKSSQVKRRMVSEVMEHAEKEGLVKDLTERESQVLSMFAASLCPKSVRVLKEGYRLRKVGMCSFAELRKTEAEAEKETGDSGAVRQHSEISYRILSSVDEYRGAADGILYYTEHWDGSGQPAGLAGEAIPLISRILALTEAYFEGMSLEEIKEKSGKWFDPKLVELLFCMKEIRGQEEL